VADRAFGIRIPKVESVGDVERVTARAPGKPIICAIESARGVLAAQEIAAVPGVRFLAMGGVDLQRDLNTSGGNLQTLVTCVPHSCEVVVAGDVSDLPNKNSLPCKGFTSSIGIIRRSVAPTLAWTLRSTNCIESTFSMPMLRGAYYVLVFAKGAFPDELDRPEGELKRGSRLHVGRRPVILSLRRQGVVVDHG
jgi:hypothetical protein